MDAKQIFDEIMSTTSFVCALPQDDTHSWVTGQTDLSGYDDDGAWIYDVVVEFVSDGDVDEAHVALTTDIVKQLDAATPLKAQRFVVKCHVAFDGSIKVHNLDPSMAVWLASYLGKEYGFLSRYCGGDGHFADTLYVSAKEVA